MTAPKRIWTHPPYTGVHEEDLDGNNPLIQYIRFDVISSIKQRLREEDMDSNFAWSELMETVLDIIDEEVAK